MDKATQAFCLFVDEDTETSVPTQPASGGLRYFELERCEGIADEGGKLARVKRGDAVVRLETIQRKPHRLLLMSAGPEARVRVNGAGVARLAALNSGDVLDVDGHVLHVSLLNRPYVGPPDEKDLESTCGFCRVRIQNKPNMRVYVCPNCRLPTHNQGEEVPEGKRLACAHASPNCGHCQAEIVETEGFTYVPTL